MFRLLSVILLIAGLALVGWGAYRYLSPQPVGDPVAADSSPRDLRPQAMEVPAAPMAAFEAEDSDTFSAASTRSSMIDRLRTVPIAHETPATARFNRSFEVTVAIDATGDDTAADALPGDGNIVEGEAQVLAKAQATLTGSAFEIELVSPSVQVVSLTQENVWRWKVMPTKTGRHPLRIELFALDNNEALPIMTYTDEVEVKVSRLGQIIATADEFDPLFMIVGGIGSLLAGLIGALRFFKGR